MLKPICILLYEDKPDYAASFKLAAAKQRIIVEDFDNADSILEALEGNPRKHKFVVLDARAYLHEGQTSGTESEANLIKVFREIQRISKEQNRVIPYCINTGFAELKLQYTELVECEIFEKGNENDLFECIWNAYNNLEATKLRNDYPDIFNFADEFFDIPNLELLTKLLENQNFKSNNIADRVDNLSRLRRLNEHLMDIFREKYLVTDLALITSNIGKRTIEILEFANKNTVLKISGNFTNSVRNIYYTCSSFGSHTPEQAKTIKEYPSQYDVEGMTNSYLGTIIWLKNKLEN